MLGNLFWDEKDTKKKRNKVLTSFLLLGDPPGARTCLVIRLGLEPRTPTLKVLCSTC